MPLYEYQCDACEQITEFNMKMSDPHPVTCPQCGKGPLQKLMSKTSFKLAGGGWYSEGYDGQSNKEAKEKSAKKSDNKPDTKAGDSSGGSKSSGSDNKTQSSSSSSSSTSSSKSTATPSTSSSST